VPVISVTIPGNPIAKERARSRGFCKPYNPQRREEDHFILLAAGQIRKKAPKDEPVTLRCVFWMPVPKSYSRTKIRTIDENGGAHVYKPDTDNLVKFVKDCLNGIAWHDDSQVWKVECRKLYGSIAKTDIEIEWSERVRIEKVPGVKIKRLVSEPV